MANGKTTLIPYFIQVRLAPQLRQLLQMPTLYDSLQYSRTRTKRNMNNMEDMYDGDKYKEMTSTTKGFLSNVYNFSATINTDGCSVANSSNASAWPILLQINELPPHLRKRHILLGGIYVGSTHPHLNTFLNPTIKELQELYQIGVVWKDSVDGSERISKIVTAVCSVDTIAKSEVLNITRLNGSYGCTFCLHEGKNKMTGNTLRGRVYPVSGITKLRTDKDIRTNMMEAHLSERKKRINGVRGVSPMETLYEFNLATGVVIESMHNVYLGVAKFHTMMLLYGKATEKWYCGSPSTLSAIDDQLTRIQRPSKISRSARSLKNMKNWKATEWRNWIIYYAIVCMQEYIPESHVKHLAKLSSAVYIYNKDSISAHELEQARRLINDYVKEFQDTFGEENMRYNIHLLMHLPDIVQNWGPLWAHSAFPFELWNKKIIDYVTSANSRPLQIVTRQMMFIFMESLLHEESIKDDTKESIMSTLYGGGKKGRQLGKHNDAFKFEGNGKSDTPAPIEWESQALQAAGFNNVQSLTSYRTVTMRGLNYEIPDTTQTKLYCDEYVHCDFGFVRIMDIVECTDESNNVIVHGLFVTCMQSVSNVYEARHIHRVELHSTDKRFVCVDDEPPRPAVRITDLK